MACSTQKRVHILYVVNAVVYRMTEPGNTRLILFFRFVFYFVFFFFFFFPSPKTAEKENGGSTLYASARCCTISLSRLQHPTNYYVLSVLLRGLSIFPNCEWKRERERSSRVREGFYVLQVSIILAAARSTLLFVVGIVCSWPLWCQRGGKVEGGWNGIMKRLLRIFGVSSEV